LLLPIYAVVVVSFAHFRQQQQLLLLPTVSWAAIRNLCANGHVRTDTRRPNTTTNTINYTVSFDQVK
jgi:hypothetical protein